MTWPVAWRQSDDKTVQSDTDQGPAETERQRARGTGRAPIKSTGLDERSREIERSLGAR